MTILEKVEVIKNQKDQYLLPENLKKDITLLGVTGTLEGGKGAVKLFNNTTQMQADTTAKEGDLAVVYRGEVSHWQQDTQSSIITFPQTVTLPSTLEDYIGIYLRAVDSSVSIGCWGGISSTGGSISIYTNSTSYRIVYTSSDGITFTRTDSEDITIDLGTDVYYESYGEWNDNVGYFMQTGGNVFEGLYQYSPYNDTEHIKFLLTSGLSVSGQTISLVKTYSEEYDLNQIKTCLTNIIENYEYSGTPFINVFINSSNQLCASVIRKKSSQKLQDQGMSSLAYDSSTSKWYTGVYCTNSYNWYECLVFSLNLSQGTATLVSTIDDSQSIAQSTTNNYSYYYLGTKTIPLVLYGTNFKLSPDNTYIWYFDSSRVATININEKLNDYPVKFKYVIAKSQLSLSLPNNLLSNKIAYGKNGIIKGSMPNLGSRTIYPSSEQQSLGPGYINNLTIKPASMSEGFIKAEAICTTDPTKVAPTLFSQPTGTLYSPCGYIFDAFKYKATHVIAKTSNQTIDTYTINNTSFTNKKSYSYSELGIRDANSNIASRINCVRATNSNFKYPYIVVSASNADAGKNVLNILPYSIVNNELVIKPAQVWSSSMNPAYSNYYEIAISPDGTKIAVTSYGVDNSYASVNTKACIYLYKFNIEDSTISHTGTITTSGFNLIPQFINNNLLYVAKNNYPLGMITVLNDNGSIIKTSTYGNLVGVDSKGEHMLLINTSSGVKINVVNISIDYSTGTITQNSSTLVDISDSATTSSPSFYQGLIFSDSNIFLLCYSLPNANYSSSRTYSIDFSNNTFTLLGSQDDASFSANKCLTITASRTTVSQDNRFVNLYKKYLTVGSSESEIIEIRYNGEIFSKDS